MGWEIEDERTHAEAVAPSFDERSRDVSLLVLRGPDVGRLFVIAPPGGGIGRDPEAAVCLSDPTISRRAASLELSGDGTLMLSDAGSRNGVYVNGVRIARAELVDGNQVQLSNDTVLRVRFQHPSETELFDRMQVAVTRDSLTGLPNRRYLSERLLDEISYSRRRAEPFCLALMDVDDYRKVVDTDGQVGADRLLSGIAKLVRAAARREDVVARYGRDELAVVLRGTSMTQARSFADRALASIGAAVIDVGDVPLRPSVTIGLVSYHETAADSPKAVSSEDGSKLLARAEAAVYQGKMAGKGCVACWQD